MSKRIKNSTMFILSIAFAFTTISFKADDTLCNVKELKEKAKNTLGIYKYDSSELTRIVYKNTESIKEIEVPLFASEQYKVIFEMEALPKQIEVRIYNKDKDSKNRKLLFTSKNLGNKNEFEFEVAKLRQIYVDYIIPAVETGSYSGCAVFMVGYK